MLELQIYMKHQKQIFKTLRKYALYLAFVQAWAATLGSLYFSEFQHLVPCTLCWYQRILMYPLTIIFFVAIKRKDKNVPYYALPFSIIGIFVALYQYMLQMGIFFKENLVSCSSAVPCKTIQLQILGFITLPFLSLLAFLTISILMIVMIKSKAK